MGREPTFDRGMPGRRASRMMSGRYRPRCDRRARSLPQVFSKPSGSLGVTPEPGRRSIANRVRSLTSRESLRRATGSQATFAQRALAASVSLRAVTWRRPSGTALLFAAAGVALVVRIVTWSPAMGADDWAYAAWGRTLWAGHLQLQPANTYAKPLGYLLGFVAAPFAADRAIPIVSAVALAAAVTGVFRAGRRAGGPAGALASTAALVFAPGFEHSLQWAGIDGIVGALVAVALATRGRAQVSLLVVAGLARIEAWPVAAVAAFQAGSGRSLPVRVASAIAAGVAAPLIWAGCDVITWGHPFAFIRQLHGGHSSSFPADLWRSPAGGPHLGYLNPGSAASAVWSSTAAEAGIVTLLAAVAGLLVLAVRAAKRRQVDLTLAAALIWAAALFVEFQHGLQSFDRYTFPLVVLLAIAVAPLAGRIPWQGDLPVFAIAAICAALTGVWAVTTDQHPPQPETTRAQLVSASLPQLRAALACGRMGVFATRLPASPIAPLIAVLANAQPASLPTLHAASAARGYPSTLMPLNIGGRIPPGRRVTLPIGVLVLSPACSSRFDSGIG